MIKYQSQLLQPTWSEEARSHCCWSPRVCQYRSRPCAVGRTENTAKHLGWEVLKGEDICWKLRSNWRTCRLGSNGVFSINDIHFYSCILNIATITSRLSGYLPSVRTWANHWTICLWFGVRNLTSKFFDDRRMYMSCFILHTSYPSLHLLTLTVLQHWILIYFWKRDLYRLCMHDYDDIIWLYKTNMCFLSIFYMPPKLEIFPWWPLEDHLLLLDAAGHAWAMGDPHAAGATWHALFLFSQLQGFSFFLKMVNSLEWRSCEACWGETSCKALEKTCMYYYIYIIFIDANKNGITLWISLSFSMRSMVFSSHRKAIPGRQRFGGGRLGGFLTDLRWWCAEDLDIKMPVLGRKNWHAHNMQMVDSP